MNTQRTRRLLIVAFALSLLIHVLLATGARWRTTSLETDVEHVSIVTRMRIAHATPPPATPVPPRPHPAPSNVPTSHSKTLGGRGAEVAAAASQPTPAPTSVPTPAPSATANCMNSDALTAMTASPPPVEIPPAARPDATSGTTHVEVDLNEHGVVTAVSITTSSGNPALDIVAETAARLAQYSPATHACKAIASSYDFTMKWSPW